MRRVIAATASLLLGGAVALGATPPAVAGTAQTINVNAEEATFHYTDVGRRGQTAGDYFDLTERLFQHGTRVGRDVVHCAVKRVTKRSFTYQCFGTLTFRGKGDLTIQGAITQSENSGNPVLAVTGGTGDYAGASGQFEITETTGRDHYVITLL